MEKEKLKRIARFSKHFLFVIPGILAFALQRILALFPEHTEYIFSLGVYRVISYPIAFFVSMIPFSLTEISLYMAIPGTVFLLVVFIRKIKKSEKKGLIILRWAKTFGWILSGAYLAFMLLMGLNYSRMPMNEVLGMEVKDRYVHELEEICYILLEKTNSSREKVAEDSEGVMILSNGIDNALKTGYLGYREISQEHKMFKIPARSAKGVIFSRRWSYSGTAGMFFPFFVEANVNIDMPESAIPSVIMHELAHTIGVARENEAEFSAFLSGKNHPDPDFVYSAYLKAYRHASRALARADREAYDELVKHLSEGVKRDIAAGREYWRQFEGPVREVSVAVNHAYLQSNLQDDGVKSYGRVVDLILAYYLSE